MAESAIDARARRHATRVGLRATKSRWRAGTCDNLGGWRLIDPLRNEVVQGVHYDLNGEQVVEWCKEQKPAVPYGPGSDVMCYAGPLKEESAEKKAMAAAELREAERRAIEAIRQAGQEIFRLHVARAASKAREAA